MNVYICLCVVWFGVCVCVCMCVCVRARVCMANASVFWRVSVITVVGFVTIGVLRNKKTGVLSFYGKGIR